MAFAALAGTGNRQSVITFSVGHVPFQNERDVRWAVVVNGDLDDYNWQELV